MRLTDPTQLREVLGIPFSEQQLAAIAAPLEPAVVIAGAGSGKTTVMAARVVWLVGSGQVDADQVLGLTFTRKAAGELAARVRRALLEAGVADPDGAEELIGTYDSFAGRLVAEHGLLLGIEGGSRMITGAARYRLAARVVADAPGPLPELSRLRPITVTERVLELSGQMRSHLVGPAVLASHAEMFAAALDAAPRRSGAVEYKAVQEARAADAERLELATLVVAYERLKAELGYVEFADQMAAAARLAAEVPSVASTVRNEFAVVLLDEYQDTSAAQATMLRGLFSGTEVRSGRGHPVTAVGDPCQAIYGWRGAAASNILDFARHFPRADGRPAVGYALTVNRRSGQQILDAANELAAGVRSDPALAAHGLDLDLVAPADTPPGRVEVVGHVTWPDEVAELADRVADLHVSGAVADWSQIAVLCRRNTHVASVYAALVERDVPAEIVGLGGLLDLPAIAEVVATLTLMSDATANPAAVRLLTSARWAIGIPDLSLLGRRARELSKAKTDSSAEPLAGVVPGGGSTTPSLLEALADPGQLAYSREAKLRFAAFTNEVTTLRRHAGEPVTELVARVIAALGLPVETEVAEPGGSAPLGAFVQAVAGYTDIDAEASLEGLLAWFEAERSYGIGLDQGVVSAADSVKVLTVHKAKGLEWEVVFLPALTTGVFPADRVTGNWLRNSSALPYPLRGDAAALPQLGAVDNRQMTAFGEDLITQQRLSEDRLAYVAVTRARQLLVASSHTWAATLARPRRPSKYFDVLCPYAAEVRLPEQVPETNPLVVAVESSDWPAVGGTEAFTLRRAAAEWVRAARRQRAEGGDYPNPVGLDLDGADQVGRWRRAAESLTAADLADRAARSRSLPDYLSVTGVGQLNRDPQAFATTLRRPMPRLVSEAQRWGIGFHRWLEERFARQSPLVDDDPELELAGAEFDQLRAGFEASPYVDAVPLAVETPFTLVLGGRLIRGRIDAVFATPEGRAQVVDWKTGNVAAADPLQLACYRLAWAELNGLDPAEVDAVFYDLHTAQVVRPETLVGRAELEQLLHSRLGSLGR
jgi:DNA helicase II / ATP-dependent DNA helicase PcrA